MKLFTRALLALFFMASGLTAQVRTTVEITVLEPPPVPDTIIASPLFAEGSIGDTIVITASVQDSTGTPLDSIPISWSVSDGNKAEIIDWQGGILRVRLLAPGRVDVTGEVVDTIAPPPGGGPDPNPTPEGWNEPEGFVTVLDEDWEDWLSADYGDLEYWHTCTNEGSTEIVDGRIVWTLPAGKTGGSVPCAKVVNEGWRITTGPWQYHRDEGLVVSEGFHGHQSSVNKWRYWTDYSASPNGGIVLFVGTDDGPLTIGVNGDWPPGLGDFGSGRLRWDGPNNLASPTREEALVVRGSSNTLETLLNMGTPGEQDGALYLWWNGNLILHYEGFMYTPPGEVARSTAIHLAPVWGGTGDVNPRESTISVDRSYMSTCCA